jgi:hypothetical protein
VRASPARPARRHRAAARRRLHRGDAERVREAVRETAPRRHPYAVRLAGHRPRSSQQIRRIQSAGRSMSSKPARPPCSMPNRRARCWTASTSPAWSGCAIVR